MKQFTPLLLFLLSSAQVICQPSFEFDKSIDLSFRPNQIAINSNGECIILSDENELYLIDLDGMIEKLSDKLNLSTGSIITTIAGTRSSRIYIGSSLDGLFEYENTNIRQINDSMGLDADSITSVFEKEYLGENVVYVGTNQELYASYDYGASFEKIDLNPSIDEDFPCTVYEGRSDYATVESLGPFGFSSCDSDEPKVRIYGASSIWDTIFKDESIPGNVLSRITTTTTNINRDPTFNIATDQGLYQRTWSCYNTSYYLISDLIINSFGEIKLYPSQIFNGVPEETYILAGANNGLYISSGRNTTGFSLIELTSELDILDVQFNECTAQIYAASPNSLIVLNSIVDYSSDKVDLTNAISLSGELFMCQGDSITIESTSGGINLYDRKWLKNGNEIESEFGRYVTVKDSGEYSVLYNHCLFDEEQITVPIRIKYYTRESVQVIGETSFEEGTIHYVEIVESTNDSLYFGNDKLLDSNSFAVKSDTSIQVTVLTKDGCRFNNEFSFTTYPPILGINNMNLSIQLYPNPVVDNFTVIGIVEDSSLRIMDLSGSEVNVNVYHNELGQLNIECNSLLPGVYLLVIETENKIVISRKFIKI